jgi:hypothetical protein
MVITKKVDPAILEGVLGCFYGLEYTLSDQA